MYNRDILNQLLLTSNPLLSSTRLQPCKKIKSFSSEIISLPIPEMYYPQNESDEENEDQNEEFGFDN